MKSSFPLFSWREPRIRTLHYTWLAFFVTFLMWFAFIPLMPVLKAQFGLSESDVKALLLLNVAFTIPARVLIGILVDKYGPRLTYSILLALSGLLCFGFALAQSFTQLALMRFLLGFAGAGFVIGVRLVSEWFPAREVGTAEGIYAGWGNFGAAIASMSMPLLAAAFGGPEGWRYAIALTGVIALVYSVIFYRQVRDTPAGATYFRPAKTGGLEVSSRRDFYLYALISFPIYASLFVLTWRLGKFGLLSFTGSLIAYAISLALGIYHYVKIWQVNRHLFTGEHAPMPPYKFKQVAIINLTYLACFGSELAVVSMLPLFFIDTFHISPVYAGITAGSFAVMNLVARPGGGWLSDRIGRRKLLTITLIGQTVGYVLLSLVGPSWPVGLAIALTILTSVFVQGACGGVDSVMPLIQRRMTGQIAGLTGAFGNVGGVLLLTVLSFVSPHLFFLVIATLSVLAVAVVRLMDEPKGHMVEIAEDGSVQLIAME